MLPLTPALSGLLANKHTVIIIFFTGMFRKPILIALVLSCVFLLATVLAATIIIATGHPTLTIPGIPQSDISQYVTQLGLDTAYRNIALAKAYVITGWISVLFTFTSTALVWIATRDWDGSSTKNKFKMDKIQAGNTANTAAERAR